MSLFKSLARIFLRFRILIGALRSGIYGLALVAATWIFILPPSQDEQTRLSIAADSPASTEVLRQHRIAKLVLLVGTDSTFDLIAARSGEDISGAELRLRFQIIAEGRAAEAYAAASAQTGGAKFVTARQN